MNFKISHLSVITFIVTSRSGALRQDHEQNKNIESSQSQDEQAEENETTTLIDDNIYIEDQEKEKTVWKAFIQNKSFFKIVCALLSFLFLAVVVACLVSYAAIYVPISKTVLTEHNSIINVKFLNSEIGKYGLEMISGLNSWSQESVVVTVNTKVQKDIKVVMLSDKARTLSKNTSVNQNQSLVSPGINPVYVNSNLTYNVTVTGEIGTKFGVYLNRTDENGHETTKPKEYSLSASKVAVTFTSNESGYYEVKYNISTPSASIHQQGYLSYMSIDANYYTKDTESPSCTVSAGESNCEIAIPFQLFQVTIYHVVAIIDSSYSESYVLSLTTKQRQSKFLEIILLPGTLIGLIIFVIFGNCYCCRRRIKQACRCEKWVLSKLFLL